VPSRKQLCLNWDVCVSISLGFGEDYLILLTWVQWTQKYYKEILHKRDQRWMPSIYFC
jgi:hypothetical protein